MTQKDKCVNPLIKPCLDKHMTLEDFKCSPADARLLNILRIRPREDQGGQVMTATLVCHYLEMSGSWAREMNSTERKGTRSICTSEWWLVKCTSVTQAPPTQTLLASWLHITSCHSATAPPTVSSASSQGPAHYCAQLHSSPGPSI